MKSPPTSGRADPRIGTSLGVYRIESVLGRGGMGTVYLAEHTRLNRKVALKVISSELSHDEDFRRRFERESILAAALDHPGVVQVYDAGEVDDVLFIAMRYVPGTDLRHVIKEEGQLEAGRALSIVRSVAEALGDAHAEGMIHRDVKPANILLSPRRTGGGEHVYLTDFGLAKRFGANTSLTMSGYYIGTIYYSAPEQFTGKTVDARADVYSLGCVLYEALAGRVPFEREHELAMIYAHLHEPPPLVTEARSDVTSEVNDLVVRAMAKDPDDRHQSCSELIEHLDAVERSMQATVMTAPALLSPTKPTSSPPEPAVSPVAAPPPPPPAVEPSGDGRVTPPSTVRRESPRPPSRPRRGGRIFSGRFKWAAVVAAAAIVAGSIGAVALVRGDGAPSAESSGDTSQALPPVVFEDSCEGLRCTFTAGAVSGGIGILEWDFGDDSPNRVGAEVTHTFDRPGSYEVSLLAPQASGDVPLVSRIVQVTRPLADRTISLTIDQSEAVPIVEGIVRSAESPCESGAEVVIQRLTDAGWQPIKGLTAGGGGRFQGSIPDQPGRYRAVVKASSSPTVECRSAKSPTRVVAAPPAPQAPTSDSGTTDSSSDPITGSGSTDTGTSGGSGPSGGSGGSSSDCDSASAATDPECT